MAHRSDEVVVVRRGDGAMMQQAVRKRRSDDAVVVRRRDGAVMMCRGAKVMIQRSK